MKDTLDHTFQLSPEANPRAASTRLRACNRQKAWGQKRHDLRQGSVPGNISRDKSHLNRVLLAPRPFFEVAAENEALRNKLGRKRKLKSNATLVVAGVITFGREAAEMFASLPRDVQDEAFRTLAKEIASKLETSLEALIVHLDETTIHAHYSLRGYNDKGYPVSETLKYRVASELQDLTHKIMSSFHPRIERGNRKWDRIAAGAEYAETLHRSVQQLHQDLPREIEAKEAELEALRAQEADLTASVVKTADYVARLTMAQRVLTEKEVKRLHTYEERKRKKDGELIALEARISKETGELAALKDLLERREARVTAQETAVAAQAADLGRAKAEIEAKEQRLVEREAAIRAREEAAEKERAFLTAAGKELIKREDAVKLDSAEVSKDKDTYRAGVEALNAVVAELDAGTATLNTATGRIRLENPSPVQSLPAEQRSAILRPLGQLLERMLNVERQEAWLGRMIKRVKSFLERDDLPEEARVDAEKIERDLDP